MASFDFSALTPDIIINGLESAGFSVASGLLALNSYENRVYQFSDHNNQRFVTKFYRPQRWSTATILEEHQFGLELAAHELPVVAPLLVNEQSLFTYQDYQFAVFPCKGGRIFEVDNLEQLEWMGRFIGRIHAISATKTFQHRETINTKAMLSEASEVIANSGFVPDNLQNAFFTVLKQVVVLASEQYVSEHSIRLHGDCHAGNILWTVNGPHFVDLDDCKMGPAIQDLWMMLSGDRAQQLLQLDTLLSGYEEFFSFKPQQLNLIESLRTMRLVNYMAWLCKRWQDPAFPRNFPWFNSQKYWEQQILILKEQYAALQEPPLTLSPTI